MPKTSGRRNLTLDERATAVRIAEEGFQIKDIAAVFKRDRHTIQHALKRYKVRGCHNDAPRSGRLLKLKDGDVRYLGHIILKDRRQTLGDITNTLNGSLTVPVLKDTVRCVIQNRLRLNSQIAHQKPYLKQVHILKRLSFACMARTWTEAEHHHIIWTDTSSIEKGRLSWRP